MRIRYIVAVEDEHLLEGKPSVWGRQGILRTAEDMGWEVRVVEGKMEAIETVEIDSDVWMNSAGPVTK